MSKHLVLGTSITNLLMQAIGLVTAIIVARSLGPGGRGEWAFALLWPSIMMTLSLIGGDVQLTREAGKLKADGIRARAVRFGSINGVGGYVLFVLVSFTLFPGDKEALMHVVQIIALAIPASVLNVYLFSVALGRGALWIFNLGRAAFTCVYVLLLIGLALGQLVTLQSLAASFVVSAYVAAFSTWFLLGRIEHGSHRDVISYPYRTFAKSGLPFLLLSALQIVSLQLPVAIMSYVGKFEDVGLLVVGLVIAQSHWAISSAIGKVVMSKESRAAVSNFTSDTRQPFSHYFAWVAASAFAVFLGGYLLLPLLFGEPFARTREILGYLVIATTAQAVTGILDEFCKGRGAAFPGVWSRTVFVIALLIAGIIATRTHGLKGFAIALPLVATVELIAMALLARHYARRRLGPRT